MDNQPSSSTTRLYEDDTTNLERQLDTYSKLLVAYNERVQMMHTPMFNNKQCQYLLDKLNEVTKSSSEFLKTSSGALLESCAPPKLEKHIFSFKLLFVLATEIERFIEGCSQDAWVPIAMTLTNVLEFVSSMAFHLELCHVALSQKSRGSRGLTLDQVVDKSKEVYDIVKTKASMDKEALLKKISLALPSLHGDEKDLASYLLQRLLRVAPSPSIPLPESKWDVSQYLAFWRGISQKVKEGVSLGRGASATVYKAMWLGMEVALKVFYGTNNPEFKKEVEILLGLYHPNITSMFCYAQERQKCSIFMELMDGDLRRLMEKRLEVNHDSPPFNIWEAIDLMHQIAEGGKYLHEQRIVHRDLKSMNILVKSVKIPSMDLEYIQAKVADFNVSKFKKNNITNTTLTPNVGSNNWMAPELIQLERGNDEKHDAMSNQSLPKHPYKCDIHSFAMVCYEILSGRLPFGDIGNRKKMKEQILQGDRPELPDECPSQLRVLIEKCWDPEPESRPTFDDICRELKYVKYVLMTDASSTSKTNKDVNQMMDMYIDALEDFDKAIEIEPNDAIILQQRGAVKSTMKKYANALVDLKKPNELQSNDVVTLKTQGEVKMLMGEYVDALEDFNRAHELEPNDAIILMKRGEVKMSMEEDADALEDFNRALELEPNDAIILVKRGTVKSMMNMYIDALEDLNKANELQPNNATTLKIRGEIKQLMGEYVDALEDLNKANELEPNDATTLWWRAKVNNKMKKYADALEDLNKANELKPNDVATLKVRAEVQGMMGKLVNALEDFNIVDELEPNNVLTLKMRAEVKKMMGKYTDALEDLNKANELEPNDVMTLKMCAEAKLLLGKYVDALEDLNRVHELEPNDVITSAKRGAIMSIMKR